MLKSMITGFVACALCAACSGDLARFERSAASVPPPDSEPTLPTDTCADLDALYRAGQLAVNVEYSGAHGFRFEAFDGDDIEHGLDTCRDVEDALSQLTESGAPGATMDYWTKSARITATRGLMDTARARAMEAGGLFRIASVAKTYVGALAALLALEDRLDLDNRDGQHALQDYLPELEGKLEYADRITVRQLLEHTSGIPDYFGDELGPAWLSFVLDAHARGEPISEDDALALVYGRKASFEPGTSGAYSNTGYVLAARVLTRITGRPYQDELRARLLDPLGLHDTFFEKHDELDLDRLSHGYRDAREIGYDFADWFDVDQGYGFANGGVVVSARDLGDFFRALLGGHAELPSIDLAKLRALQQPHGDGYGLGVIAAQGCLWHAGNFSGYSARAFHCLQTDATGVLFSNTNAQAQEDLLDAMTQRWQQRAR